MQNYAGQENVQQYGRINMSMTEDDFAYRGGGGHNYSSSSDLPHYNMNQMTGAPGNYNDISKYGGAGLGGYNSGAGSSGLRKRNVQAAIEEDIEDGGKNQVKSTAELNSSGEEGHALIAKKKKVQQDKLPVCYSLRRCCGCLISREKRYIRLDGRRRPTSFPTNRENNQKYNVCSLIPLVLFNQFKFFYNFFFLLISLSQFIPPLKVGFLFTYVAPLVFVLLITILKELFDDIQRMRKDRELNNKKYE